MGEFLPRLIGGRHGWPRPAVKNDLPLPVIEQPDRGRAGEMAADRTGAPGRERTPDFGKAFVVVFSMLAGVGQLLSRHAEHAEQSRGLGALGTQR